MPKRYGRIRPPDVSGTEAPNNRGAADVLPTVVMVVKERKGAKKVWSN